MLHFAGQNVSWKMDGEACPAGGSWTVSAVPGSLTDSSGVVFADVLARSSNVFSNSVSADRTVMAASRFLGAAAACVMLFIVFCSWTP